MVNTEGNAGSSRADVGVNTKKPSVHYPSECDVPRTDQKLNIEEHTVKALSIADTDDEDFEDIYDWSTDEDLIGQDTDFGQTVGGGENPPKRWGSKRIATFFLSTLVGSTLLACLIVAVPLALHFLYLVPNPTQHHQYITDNVSAWLYWAAANILLSWYLAMIVDIIPGMCDMVIDLAWGEVTETVRSRIELYNAAKDNIKPVLYGASCWVSWIVVFDGIYHLYNQHDEALSSAPYTARTYQTIQFLFFLTLVLSTERMLGHMIAFSFHRKAYNDRLEALKHDMKVIDHLRGYRPKRQAPKPSYHRPIFSLSGLTTSPPHEKSGFSFGRGRIAGEKQELLHHHPVKHDALSDDEAHIGDIEEGTGRVGQTSKKGKERRSWIFPSMFPSRQSSQSTSDSATTSTPADQPYNNCEPHTYPPTKHTLDPGTNSRLGRATPQPSRSREEDPTVVTQAAKVLKSAVMHDARNIKGKEGDQSGLGWKIKSAHDAKRLAKSIYVAFNSDHHRKYLVPSDLYPAYARNEDAEEAFRVFDKDNNGDISRAEIKTKVLEVFKERRALSRSLRDVNKALKTLDGIMMFLAMVVLFFISLSVFRIGIGNSLTSFYTIGIAASFIFKNSASSAFDAVIFLFVTHPFDTGDRVFVDAENLVVKEMGLFATTFTRADGTETYYFHSLLFTKFITNVQRSGKMFENMTLQVAWRTPLEKLDQLEKHMNEWLATEENRWFEPNTAVTLQKIDYQRCLEFTMGIVHNGTWQDWSLRIARKTAFLAAAHFYCRQLGITFYNSPQPILIAETEEQVSRVGLQIPSSPKTLSPGPWEPNSPGGSYMRSMNDATLESDEETKETFTTVLGFTPPPDKRSALTRARKSRLRKRNIRGMADGASGS